MHNSWLNESRKGTKYANVLIDGPGLHLGAGKTANHSYLSFHGRNYDVWYKEEKEDDHRLVRYDYLKQKGGGSWTLVRRSKRQSKKQ